MTKLSALDALRLQYLSQHGGLLSDPPMPLSTDEKDDTPITPTSDPAAAGGASTPSMVFRHEETSKEEQQIWNSNN